MYRPWVRPWRIWQSVWSANTAGVGFRPCCLRFVILPPIPPIDPGNYIITINFSKTFFCFYFERRRGHFISFSRVNGANHEATRGRRRYFIEINARHNKKICIGVFTTNNSAPVRATDVNITTLLLYARCSYKTKIPSASPIASYC